MAIAHLYEQVAHALRTRIGQGAWKPGDRLPSEPELCKEFGVSSITMRRTLSLLAAEGLIVRLQGKGTFVASTEAIVQGPPELTSFTEDLRLRGWRATSRVLLAQVGPGPAEVCARLALAPGALVTTIRRVRLADARPIAIQTAHLPALLFPGLEQVDLATVSLYETLSSRYGVTPAEASETWHASLISEDVADLLDVAVGSPAFAGQRVTLDSLGRRIELVESILRGDRYTLVLSLRAPRSARRLGLNSIAAETAPLVPATVSERVGG